MAVAGLLFLFAGFVGGYFLRFPHTVYERVSMWASPWSNLIHGGDQLAQSLWAYATGGLFGTGLGLGDPQLVPAAHTDLILSALGEEWGFVGLLAVFALYGFLLYRAARIALRARSDYEFFLATGLAVAMGLQILLIAGGSLGVLPLSGVVTPFLSYGRTSMLANFLVMAVLLSISSRGGDTQRNAPFRAPLEAAGLVLGALAAIVLAKAAYVQALRSGPIVGEGTLVVQADGARRYQYNPRFQEVMAEIPKGRNLRPQRDSAGHQQLGRAGKASGAIPAAGHQYRPGLLAHREPALSVRGPDLRLAGRSAHAHTLGRQQHFVRGARFGHAAARLRRPAHAGGRAESEDRQDGAHRALRPARAGAIAAASLRAERSGGAAGARAGARRAHVDRCAPAGARGRDPEKGATASRSG
jgi:hypothetical protein